MKLKLFSSVQIHYQKQRGMGERVDKSERKKCIIFTHSHTEREKRREMGEGMGEDDEVCRTKISIEEKPRSRKERAKRISNCGRWQPWIRERAAAAEGLSTLLENCLKLQTQQLLWDGLFFFSKWNYPFTLKTKTLRRWRSVRSGIVRLKSYKV